MEKLLWKYPWKYSRKQNSTGEESR